MHGNFNEEITATILTTELSDHNNADQSMAAEDKEDYNLVKFELDVSVPSFEIEIMKLKLIPGLQQVANPGSFEKWVTYAMIGMSLWFEQRP